MKAVLECEVFGDDLRQRVRLFVDILNEGAPGVGDMLGGLQPSCWCARIAGRDPRFGLRREFLRGKKDYRDANSVGSRGVKMYYTLESGHYYEVKRRVSWRHSERFFCTVTDDGDVIEVTKEEVLNGAQL